MALRAQAPDSWEHLVEAMNGYSAQVLAETLRAPPELIVRAQGMAIQANEIAGILRDAPKMYEQAQAAALAKARAPNNGRHTTATGRRMDPLKSPSSCASSSSMSMRCTLTGRRPATAPNPLRRTPVPPILPILRQLLRRLETGLSPPLLPFLRYSRRRMNRPGSRSSSRSRVGSTRCCAPTRR